ncbi:MAG TPA: feruloyl-CoA synthase, partial [Telluria sp.]
PPLERIAHPAVHASAHGRVWHVDATTPLAPYPLRLLDRLAAGARNHPQRTLLAQRSGDRDGAGAWQRLSYAEALASARCIGQALHARGLGPERPLVILSGNDLQHFQLALGAMYAGVPYAPLSPAYALACTDFTRLHQMVGLLTPGAIYTSDGAAFGAAIDAVLPAGCEWIVDTPGARPATAFAHLLATAPGDIDAAMAQTGPDTIAKFLFTSGSTGADAPKAVITTQRMLCSNQQMLLQTLPFMGAIPPVLVDWLPWSHTFGGSHNAGIALYNGGTLYIDGGKPVPGAFDTTIANLREVAPTLHFNVPRGWDLLATALERDAQLRRTFFSRTELLFCAGAALAPAIWARLQALAHAERGAPVRIMAGLGMTETAPGCLFGTGAVQDPGYVGVPAPGCRVKLAPRQGKYEACFAGPHVTPGYWRAPGRTAAAFDADGYYRTGDALRFADPADPALGFLFDGRLAEDFKLDSGTWVGTTALRARLLAHGAPCVLEAVIAGSGRASVAALVFARFDACHALSGLAPDASAADILASAPVRAHFAATLAAANRDATGSSTRVERLLVLDAAPDAAQRELTDKGSVNQAAVLSNRAALVDAMYDGSAPGMLVHSGFARAP